MFCAELRVLFCVAGSDCQAQERFDRAVRLARELGVRPLVAIRGHERSREDALAFGLDVVAADAVTAIRSIHPDLVVVDEPSAAYAQEEIDAAKAVGATVVRINDSLQLDDSQRAPRVVTVAAALSQGNN